MNEMLNYIDPGLFVLIPVLCLVGAGLKKSRKVKDELIPALLGLCGVGFAVVYILSTSELSGWKSALAAAFSAATQGVLCAGASVYLSQIVKQARKGGEKKNENL